MTRPAAGDTRAQAVLFDMDGLLVDSEPVGYDVESALVAELGGTWGPEHQHRTMGGTLRDTAAYIADLTGSSRPVEALMADLVVGMTDHFRTGLPLRPGAVPAIDAVRGAGVPTALVTSTYRVPAGKPDPAPYLTACARLDVDPRACVVLEDAPTGVAAGEAAGCVVVAVPSAIPIPTTRRRPVLAT